MLNKDERRLKFICGGCFLGEIGVNDATAVKNCVADFLPAFERFLFVTVPDFRLVAGRFYACFGGPFLTVK